jgi:type I restriction enzyme S subunit
MEGKKNKPEIRFAGFTESWEQRKLSELATMNARIGWQNLRTSEFLDCGKYLLITGTDFEDGAINYSTCHYVEKSRYEQDKNIQITDGSILITKDGTLGKVAYVNGLTMPATLNAGVFNVQLKDIHKTNGKYLFQYLKAPYLMEYVAKNATGGTIKHLNQNILVNFPIVLPNSDEQTKIGDNFFAIDNLITLHQRKCEKLKIIKKSLLEKMFPKEGKKVPELRFNNFTEDWEQRKLGQLADIIGGGTPSTSVSNFWDGDIDWYSPAEISDQVFVNSSQRKITLKGYNKSSSKMLPIGTVLFTSRAGIGKSAILLRPGCTNQGFQSIVPYKNELDSYFIFSRTKELKQYGERVGAGSTFVEVSGKQMADMNIQMPSSLEEQKTIGNIFMHIDNLITLHQRKLEKLKNMKKSMLEKMFV